MAKKKTPGQKWADEQVATSRAKEVAMKDQLLKDHTRRQKAWKNDGPELTAKDETAKLKHEKMIADMVAIGNKNRKAAQKAVKKAV